ncbi:MAG: hypothetical protein GX640_07270 [Fibrobacter sp.]|nr:hypothetical protein [Fibrobacter sp.]
MKRALLLVIAAAIFSSTFASGWATSDGSCYAKGDKNLSVGLNFYWWGNYATFDYGIHDAISIGGGIGYNYWWGNFPIVVRGLFHPFNLTVLSDKIAIRDKLDVYAGLMLYILPGRSNYSPIRENFGARFHFSPKFYAFAEESGAFGYLSLGAGLKF